ncbi:T9SS type A sorting domain-containing protein [Tenacibaculum xiamenense]|uniref:T9SS type A sorting domain-containing protein n=1 Tax=Tenacibaculum xiamenense TaxID=1261553 RepID=UPI003895E28E
MKKLLLIFCALFVGQFNMLNAQCEGNNCEFANINFTPDPSFIEGNENWQPSHGSPTVNVGEVMMWSNGGIGEGINYLSYNFVAGQEYCISFLGTTEVEADDVDAYFRVALTQTPVAGTLINFSGAPLPSLPSPNQVIANQNWNATSPASTSTYTYTFTATSNFNNIWFHPFTNGSRTIRFKLQRLQICNITPCESNFKVELTEFEGGNSGLTILPYGIPAGSTYQISIFKDGVNVYSGLPISYIAAPGDYTVCMVVTLPDGKKCSKCYDFCIGRWYKRGRTEVTSEVKKESKTNFYKGEFRDDTRGANRGNSIDIFPNPTKGVFKIKNRTGMKLKAIEVFDKNSGKLILSKEVKPLKSKDIEVDLSNSSEGVYLVRLVGEEGGKVVKSFILNK